MACTDGCRNRMHVVTGSGSRIDRLKMRESTSALGILAKILRPFKLQLNVFFFSKHRRKMSTTVRLANTPCLRCQRGGCGGGFHFSETGMCERMRNVQSSPLCCQSCMNDEAVLQQLEVPGTVRTEVTPLHFIHTHTHTQTRSVTVSGTTTLTF